MKPYLLSLAIFLIVQNSYGQTFSRQQLRESFLTFRSNKNYRDSILIVYSKLKRKSPEEECFMGICIAFQIKEQTSNWDKLKLVLRARNHLNNGINRQPSDPELRYLRFAFEHYLPSFLGLNKHIEEDLALILSKLNFVDNNKELKKMVLGFLIRSKRCTDEQTKKLKSELDKLP